MRPPVATSLLAVALAAAPLALSPPRHEATAEEDDAREGPAAPVLPTQRAFRKALLKVMEGYATDGTHDYYWPRGGDWAGTTRDLVYGDGTVIAHGDPEGRCYCCGLTFEVFFRAFEEICKDAKGPTRIGDLDAAGVERLRRGWFGCDGDRHTLQKALVDFGLGEAVSDLRAARKGDFCQFWRHSGSGHSVVFLAFEWPRGADAPTAITYWSTQKATRGIGIRTEPVGAGGVKADEIYLGRAGQR